MGQRLRWLSVIMGSSTRDTFHIVFMRADKSSQFSHFNLNWSKSHWAARPCKCLRNGSTKPNKRFRFEIFDLIENEIGTKGNAKENGSIFI